MEINKKRSLGFTLIEIIVVMALFATLTSLTVFSFRSPSKSVDIDTVLVTLTSDLKQQQLRSILGDSEGSSSAKNFGVRFENNRYILFSGDNYSSTDVNNFNISLKGNLILSTDFPNNEIIFNKYSGEVASFDQTKNNIILKDNTNSTERIINVNKLGVFNIKR